MKEDFEKPFVTVDILLFSIEKGFLEGLFIERRNPPFKNQWAIPGGFVDAGEPLHDAAIRELHEETNAQGVFIEQVYAVGDPDRDPRSRVITVVYSAVVSPANLNIEADSDALKAEWIDINNLPTLAFDHQKIVDHVVKKLKLKLLFTPILFQVLPKIFSIEELEKACKCVSQDIDNFESVFNTLLDRKVILPISPQKLDPLLYSFNLSNVGWENQNIFHLY